MHYELTFSMGYSPVGKGNDVVPLEQEGSRASMREEERERRREERRVRVMGKGGLVHIASLLPLSHHAGSCSRLRKPLTCCCCPQNHTGYAVWWGLPLSPPSPSPSKALGSSFQQQLFLSRSMCSPHRPMLLQAGSCGPFPVMGWGRAGPGLHTLPAWTRYLLSVNCLTNIIRGC